MTTKQKPRSTTDAEELPLYTHVRVLGVDIGVPQRELHQGCNRDVDIRVYGRDSPTHGCRKDIAAWARRNLFDGVNSRQ